MSNILVGTTISSIDLDAAHGAMLQCAQHEADVLLAKAATFVFKAQDIMAKAREPVHDIEKRIAKAQEPLFPLESCVDQDTDLWTGTSLESDTQVWSDSSEGAYVTAARVKPSKAPRLRYK